ncbi:LOW QUALITY PROTEIN: uncharacterized protein K02A2.6 [Alosa sapidissima]|uniref:LOW QUALITY PROTEIN: uncharacterized protein K02A2.6 n=1 Tax=Alosa sapidissima TaxID=34773 RepID=UPI001C09E640|nr:LOW QUALITY PROTEIN: uncharacterized protein K02A2.6 [Alosa sapidissima]
MAYYIGRLDAFDSSTEDWNTYVERLEQFFVANEVEADKYVPVLLSVMGGKAYSLLRNLTAPEKPADKKYIRHCDIVEGIKGKIPLKDGAQATFHKARPVPYAIRPVVGKELDRLEADGILSRVDWSPWATPVVPVVKKNGTVRLCGDFKVTINPALQVEQYQLPRIKDIFAFLIFGQRFSKVDLAEAYLQMEMEEDSKKFLTINTIKVLYRYNRLVFGVASAPAIWQRAMDQVLQGVPGTQCYLDDIIVTGATDTEHLENLRQVLKRLEDYGLRARRDKCEFLKSSVTYCGHTIDANGLHKCQEKVQAVLKAPRPQDVSQLRSFLGFVNYYHRFLPRLGTTRTQTDCHVCLWTISKTNRMTATH